MLFVGIDQHKRHLTICVRNEQGEIAWRRQVSRKWEEVDRFLASLPERAAEHGGYVAVMEVCGFNGWLIKHLTHLRHRLGRALTRAKNRIKGILRRHNLV